MPWNSSDSTRHTKKARSPKDKRQWSAVANSMLKRGKSEGAATRAANSVIKRKKVRKAKRITRR